MVLVLSGALYKTQEVWSMDSYRIFEINPIIQAGVGRRAYLAAQAASKGGPVFERQGFGGDPAEMGLSRSVGGSTL